MTEQTITCPNCKAEIPLSEALTARIRAEMESEISRDFQLRERKLAEKLTDLKEKEKEIAHRQEGADREIAEKLSAEREKIEKAAQETARKAIALELEDLKSTLAEQTSKLEEAQKNELELRKRERKLEADKKAFELELRRKLDRERETLKKEISDQLRESHELEKGDLKKKISTLTEKITELKRKAEQGSQEAQGAVQEARLEDVLEAAFPSDTIRPVPKGTKGADVVQEVYNDSGHMCGTIVWESKRTKAFNHGWIEKLKADQRSQKAELAAIYTQALPADVSGFGQIDGVWISDYRSLVGLATALRTQLMQVATTQIANVGKSQKIELLYRYLSGPEFRGRVEAIVEGFITLKSDLEHERKAMTKIWAKREKQIQKVIENTVGMYGDMQGIVGATLPEIKQLDIAVLPEPTFKEE